MNVLKKNNSDTPKITKCLHDDDEPYNSETKIKDNTRNYDETKYSSTDDSNYSTHDFPVDNPLSTKIQTGNFKRHDEILKKCRARNFKLSDFATYQSKTDDHEIEQLSSTSTRCICKPIKHRLKNQSKVCNCAPKTCRCTADQSNKNTCQNNEELSKICRTRQFKTGATDAFVPDQRKTCNCTQLHSKTDSSSIKTRKATKKLSKKSRASKFKTGTTDNFASNQYTENDVYDDNELLSLAITPADIILSPVKYKRYDHPKTIKYKGTCLAGDYGTRIFAWGDSLKEAFEQCGMALCSYMVDVTAVEIVRKIYIEIEADEVLVLLYRFIEELRSLCITGPYFHCKKLEITTFNTNKNGCFIGCNCFGEEAKKDKHWYSIAVEGTDFVNMNIINDPDKNRFEIYCLINACS